ncbi:hypothetical protein Bpfe_029201 [Biomphalaria pfeifferi]|uniref:Uncharacterized protein n=1 Tax=Biomphalaria pfeifferi TaxID=112525 RepID=A0AAD8AUU3_BIOPF|nr:hypothetical protein Bpfe_029201 [Biomphalaria pfeifferi]
MATRSSTEHSIFGNPQPMPKSQLPTSADVFRAYDYQLKFGECSSVHGRSSLIGNKVKKIYDTAGIPTIEINSVVKRVERLVAKVKELNKYSTSKKSSATFEETFQSLQSVFDVCCCKCFDSGARERSACTCSLPMKIPGLEWNFWANQKATQKMYIGKIDQEMTMKLQKKVDRSKRQKSTETMNDVEMGDELNLCCCAPSDVNGMHNDYDDNDDDDVVHSDDNDDQEIKAVRNTLQYPELCRSLDRCKASNRDACLIVNSLLKDLNLLTAESCVNPAKLRRQRKVWRQK